MSVEQALRGARPGTARPITSLGREIRLGTASMASSNGVFIDVDRINTKKYARERPALAMALTDYLLLVDVNPRKALDIAAESTVVAQYSDWWWKAKLGRCYFKLGMLREAEKQYKSSLKDQPMVSTYLELSNVYLRLDLPNTALEVLTSASEQFPTEPKLTLFRARIYDMLNNDEEAMQLYKLTLQHDASNIEAIACVAAHNFYADQPEMAMRFYRRLLQMGVNSAELWNNLGLCCFQASQYDVALHCFERALPLADDSNMADVWYNIGHVAIGIGDAGLAYQAFKVAVSVDPNHAEAHNNLGVLESRRKQFDAARSCYYTSLRLGRLFEPHFNAALLSHRSGDFQEAHKMATISKDIYPSHAETLELLKNLQEMLNSRS